MRRLALAGVLIALAGSAAAGSATGPPPAGLVPAHTGAALYAANCSSCHGPHGEGISPPARPGVGDLGGLGPSLADAGALAADFYLRTGYMPLRSPDVQPSRSQVLFSQPDLRRLVTYVAGLGHGPAIPHPDPASGTVSQGLQLFTDHCAGCHQVAAEGGYVTGARVPPLQQATDREIAEAVRIGPYVMPAFSARAISNAQLDSLIRYLDYARHPDDPGGWAIGRIGPVPEGLVAWLIAGSVLLLGCLAVSRRARFDRSRS
ncbi:MAG TPA: c-type cytochrome [Gaiellaceae bacterium]|jgi:ubiquinol-cytochrome c reductase cytochrome c subunit|nr:c-type cytochrome [Gaiellaceae bacterium]